MVVSGKIGVFAKTDATGKRVNYTTRLETRNEKGELACQYISVLFKKNINKEEFKAGYVYNLNLREKGNDFTIISREVEGETVIKQVIFLGEFDVLNKYELKRK